MVLRTSTRISRKSKKKGLKTKARTRRRKVSKGRVSRKFKGGLNPLAMTQSYIDSARIYIKETLLSSILSNQPDNIQDLVKNSDKFKKIDRKIDLFLDRTETLIQRTIQTSATTGIKIMTSPIPGISFVGALITTTINWIVIYFKAALRGYDAYNIFSEIKALVQENGGTKIANWEDFTKSSLGELDKMKASGSENASNLANNAKNNFRRARDAANAVNISKQLVNEVNRYQ